jgi:purine-binding chemotaxis protein CheW
MGAARQYMTFLLGVEEYAVEILRVREVIEWKPPTRVPGMPACIRGVIDLRGAVVPVIDLAVKFGGAECAPSKWTCIVILELALDGEPAQLAVIADVMGRVIDLVDGDVEPPPPFGTRVLPEYLRGMARLPERFALILDVDRVLSNQDLHTTFDLAEREP